MAQEPQKLRFTIQGEPVPKERARTAPKMKDGQVEMIGGHPVMRTKTPDKTRAWETYVSLIARQARTRARIDRPHDGPVVLGCVFYLKIPKSWSEKKKQQAREGWLRATDVPDLSNLLKSIEDGCEGVLWLNDSSIFSYGTVDGTNTGKYYSDTPRVEVEAVLLSA
jgi:Holliday junction resolvase RusA-like endonuclease